jgi:anaerobic selenocysteine-containing dehydrogenase
MRVRTACNRDCPDGCSVIVTVEDGRVVRLQGDPDHPVTRGFLCHRTNRFLWRQHDPARLQSPLIRRDGELVPCSWDEALDHVARRLLAIRDESGPAAILHYRSGGSLGLMKHVVDHFFELFGPTATKTGDICSGAGDAAQLEDFGEEDSHDLFDLLNSRHVVLWGKNPYVASVHLLPVLERAREGGARLHLVDPVLHRTAALCETALQPRPGGDAALGLGVLRALFDEGLADPEAADYCDHLDELRALVRTRPLADWARVADVTEQDVRRLARTFADKPTALLIGWGLQRRARGSATVRVLDAVAAVSGNLGIPGGGASFYFKRRGAFDLSFLRGPEAAPRLVPEALLGRAILEARDPPIRAVWVTAGNPVTMLPDSETVRRALRSRELTVVVDSFLTDTAAAAHVVLPTTTMLEDDDVIGAYGHHWLSEVRPVVPPPAGVKTDHGILLALAPRVGLGDVFSGDAQAWKQRLLSRVAPQGASVDDLRRGAVRNPEAPRVLFEGRRFPTATGRVNLVHDVDPTPPATSPERPLLLMALSTEKAQGSQWRAQQQEVPLTATVHPASAEGFADGDLARLQSAHGSLDVLLKLDASQRRDVVLVDKGGWLAAGRCANALVPARETDRGGGACYHDTPVALVHPMW